MSVTAGSRVPAPGAETAIAVVGMSCRLPGADRPAAFWELLRAGRDALTTPATDRGEAAAGVSPAARRGGFLDDVAGFDPAFFGIAPREAAAMDPQQRLLLELAWEAMEDAGIQPATLSGSRTAVFVGAMWDDYFTLTQQYGGAALTAQSLTGGNRGMIANRVSYRFGLNGPSLSVDTGQSSSLAAVHLAMRSLRSGECTSALVAGVNLNLLPERVLSTERLGALSPDSLCYTFDSRANGYVRGEGGVCLLLKPLERAQADGDPVAGVLLGSALNNDGGGPRLTVPEERAQAAVLREAYRDAGVNAADVHYVEMHGTGTKVGDPIEAAALGAVLGWAGGRAEPLRVGSAKTNIGHLEGAAGLAGLLKTLLCVDRGELAPSLNFREAPERIPLDRLNVRVQTELTAWPAGRRLAGVSAWGMGGTNCHIVVGPAPERVVDQPDPQPDPQPVVPPPLLLSARDAAALPAQAARLRDDLAARPELGRVPVAAALLRNRTTFPHRAVVLGEATDALDLLAAGEPAPAAVTGVAEERGSTVFIFPGQGAQWEGMARQLFHDCEPFRRSLAASAAAIEKYVDWSVIDVLTGEPGAAPIERIDVVQPVLFAVMIGLAELWQAFGVCPDAVIGHSQGEIAAAYVSGALTLDDAARIVALRSRDLLEISGTGGMLSVPLGQHEVEGWLERYGDGLEIGGFNGPASTVVAGGRPELERLFAALRDDGVRVRWVPTDVAGHSAWVEVFRERLIEQLAGLAPRPSKIAFYSTVAGRRIHTAELGPEYWYDNMRQPVRFAETLELLLSDGYRTMIESSAHPVLVAAVQDAADQAGADVLVVGSLRRHGGGLSRFLDSAAQAWVRGASVDFGLVVPAVPGPPASLPTYPFQRRRFWLDTYAQLPATRGPAATTRAATPAPASATGAPTPARSNDQERWLLRMVRAAVAGTLGYASGAEIDPERTFRELGLDSAMSVDLRGRLAAGTGLRTSPAMIFDHPTPGRLARHLATELGSARPVPPEAGPVVAGPVVAGAVVAGPVEARVAEIGPGQSASRSVGAGDEIAIVGMGCRYPGGADSPEKLWQLLSDGTDAITPFPDNRGWDLTALYHPDPDHAGTAYVRSGGFLHDADRFDAGLFGISAREAQAMDPQQRLLLHVAWEALERAGIDAGTLRESRTGIFVGAMAQQYGPRLSEAPRALGGHLLTGNTVSVASGRLAYFFGTRGPALTVDTACSSSLVALHLARQALLSGECDLALVGGVCVMPDPGVFTEFSRQRGLAADGRCKPFAAAADGTAWAEGAAVVVLERTATAREHGRLVHGLVRGSAVNSDGASNGLSAPNGLAQEGVIRAALRSAALEPSDVDVVEAHGTGTRLGDPIEAEALLRAYGRQRPADRPLLISASKSAIGHTQAAAGLAGVIASVQGMRHGVVPATQHLDAPSPFVDWEAGAVRVCAERTPWPMSGRPRRAGVSAFGISGTNAHVILEAPAGPVPSEPVGGSRSPSTLPWVLSGHDAAALAERAGQLIRATERLRPVDVAYTLARGRAALSHRAVLVGDHGPALAALAAGAEHPALVTGVATQHSGPVFVFPGQGSQWLGMAVRLWDESSVFAEAMTECAAALAEHVDWSLRDMLTDAAGLARVDVVQPVLFSVMVSLAALWRSMGVEPAVVIGHSQGEIAAACVAGALSLADAARVVVLRSRALTAIAGAGAMASIGLGAEEVGKRLAGASSVVVAAFNGPASTVVAGDDTAVRRLVDALTAEEVRARLVPVDYASHSAHIEPLRDEIRSSLAAVTPGPGTIPMYSTVTGAAIDPADLDADYWYRNLRNPVLFEPVVAALREAGHDVFLEVSPHPVLTYGIQETTDRVAGATLVTGTLRRDEGGLDRFLTSAAELWVAGVPFDWMPAGSATGGQLTDLPTYPFRTQSYWLNAPGRADPARLGLDAAGHPLLGAALELPDGGRVATGVLDLDTHPWSADHRLHGATLLPGAAYVELVDAVTDGARIDELTLGAALDLTADPPVRLQVSVSAPDELGRRTVVVRSRDNQPDAPWVKHGTAVVSAAAGRPEPAGPEDAWPPAAADEVDPSELYQRFAEAGFDYGPAFRGLRRAWSSAAQLYAEVTLADVDSEGYGLHPAMFDAALQTVALATGPTVVPFTFTDVAVYRRGVTRVRVRATRLGEGQFALLLTDEEDRPVVTIGSLLLRPPSMGAARMGRIDWVPATDVPPLRVAEWALLGPDRYRLTDALRATGGAVRPSADLAALTAAGGPMPEVAVLCPGPADDVLEAVDELRREVQQWLSVGEPAGARLLVVTQGAETDPVQAARWGFIRTAQTEHPGSFALLDVDAEAVSAEAVAAALADDGAQAAMVGGRVRLPRLTPSTGRDLLTVPPVPHWRLTSTARGVLDTLQLAPFPEAGRPLGPREVRVAVRAAGVNFRDVLNALDLYPGDPGPLGMEGAGVVLEVGDEVTGMGPGDRVMGLMRGSYGPVAVTDHRLLAPVPAGWSLGAAAAVPVAFLTAYHALVDLGRVRAGETLLVHAAAGGVGQAAVQLGLHLGARVLGTASPAKWDVLRAAGLPDDRIASSRSVDFGSALRPAAGPDGVDVVLNALAGEFTDVSLRMLKPAGRFVEMGKTDPRDPERIAAEHRGVRYTTFDLTELDPGHIQQMLRAVLDLFAAGALRPLPTRFRDVRRAPGELRRLSQGAHVGKVVLTVPAVPRRDGTVLITGGTGGLGRAVARHLAATGRAGRLLLVSRSGPAAEGVAALTEELTAAGVPVETVACDVADRAALARVLDTIPAEHPLTAVVHAAGVLDDAPVTALNSEQLAAVLAPKTVGAWHLHELTRDADLADFVLFSSVAGFIGAAGQAAYAAANASLDALARLRHEQGRPARSIAWGLWAETSMMTGAMRDQDRERMRRVGILPLSTAAGLAAFDDARDRDDAVLVVARLESAAGEAPPVLRGLIGAPVVRRTESTPAVLPERLRAMSSVEQQDFLIALVREQAAAVLGRGSPETVGSAQSFQSLGFDSLTSVELRNRLNRSVGLRLPTSSVFDFPTPVRLAGRLQQLLVPAAAPGPAEITSPGAPRAAELDVADDVDIDGMAAEDLIQLALGGPDVPNAESEPR